MREKIILCSVAALIGFVFILMIVAAFRERKRNVLLEKELKERKQNAEHTAKIITEANATKAAARTGNHCDDIKFMADKLHEYARGDCPSSRNYAPGSIHQ